MAIVMVLISGAYWNYEVIHQDCSMTSEFSLLYPVFFSWLCFFADRYLYSKSGFLFSRQPVSYRRVVNECQRKREKRSGQVIDGYTKGRLEGGGGRVREGPSGAATTGQCRRKQKIAPFKPPSSSRLNPLHPIEFI
jgi:hypothetical protein